MRKFGAVKTSLEILPLTRQNLEDHIEAQYRKTIVFLKVQTVLLLGLAFIVFVVSAAFLVLNFYNSAVQVSRQGWVEVRNLTPVVAVETHINGALDQVFVSQGQLVQKGEILGALDTSAIKLDYENTQRNFVDRIIELHCLMSLQANKTVFKLPYDVGLLISEMSGPFNSEFKVDRCERELLHNILTDQSFEEAIASLDDQFRRVNNFAGKRDQKKNISVETSVSPPFMKNGTLTAFDGAGKQYANEAQRQKIQQELQKARNEYLLRKLQKQKELDVVIESTIQEIRYLDEQLRQMDKKIDKNFIYASITGTIVGPRRSEIGTYFQENEIVFEIRPVEREFQVTIPLDAEDRDRFVIGTSSMIAMGENQKQQPILMATTVAVKRTANGTLEASLDLKGNRKKNAEIILASGYRGEGIQRLPASITTGKNKIWESICSILFAKTIVGFKFIP